MLKCVFLDEELLTKDLSLVRLISEPSQALTMEHQGFKNGLTTAPQGSPAPSWNSGIRIADNSAAQSSVMPSHGNMPNMNYPISNRTHQNTGIHLNSDLHIFLHIAPEFRQSFRWSECCYVATLGG